MESRPEPPARLTPARIVALVVGCLLLLPAVGMLLAGGVLGVGYAAGRDDNGYFSTSLETLRSTSPAVTAEDLALSGDLRVADRLLEALRADVRLQVTPVADDRPVFVGIGRASEVSTYLAGVQHDEIVGVDRRDAPEYRTWRGRSLVAPPDSQRWAASASGTGTQVLDWQGSEAGRWTVVVMNADGSPGVAADVDVGVKAGFLLPLALTVTTLGLLALAGSVALIVLALHHRTGLTETEPAWSSSAVHLTAPGEIVGAPDHPVRLTAQLDPALSRWQWLVKWFLAIPHFFVLALLWPVFVVLTVVAGVCVLVTGRYPRSVFETNVGILRWSWRVSYYAASGGIGTDRYPPFTLGAAPGYPATLDIAYPQQLSRGLVLVKWWLLALPHYLILGLLLSGWWGWTSAGDVDQLADGILGLLVLVAGIVLLVTGVYPRALFDVIVGFNRWIYRVIAYAALMTDDYPPFRLDQGGSEPGPPPVDPPPSRTPQPVGGGAGR